MTARQRYYFMGLLWGFLWCPLVSMATHIIGGEVNYTCLGNDQYEVTLQLFRDCDTGVPPFDDPAEIDVLDQSGNELFVIQMVFRNNDTLSFDSSACSVIPPSACIHTTTYREVVSLPYRAGGYQLIYQICCRNQDIINIVDPTATQAAYHAFISQEALTGCNSGAKFDGWPPFYVCNGYPMDYDHSAVDVDGDSIVYELYTPYDLYPNLVTWQQPYNVSSMMGNPLPFGIDPITGVLFGTPFNNGTFIVGISAKEYRNGVLISTIRRDFQFIVTPCVSSVVADFMDSIPDCNYDLSVPFHNLSAPTLGPFEWDFGDNSPLSAVKNPVHTYPDTGWYTVRLIAAKGAPCVDTVYKQIHLVVDGTDIDVWAAPVVCNDERTLVVATNTLSNYNQITSYNWAPASLIISGQGTDSVWVRVNGGSIGLMVNATNNYNCKDTGNVVAIDMPVDIVQAAFDSIDLTCNASLSLSMINQSTALNDQFLWSFDTLATSTAIHPSYTFPDTGWYTIGLIAGVGQLCQDTTYQDVYIPLTGLSIETTTAQTICRHDTVLLTASQLPPSYTPAVDYQWMPAANIIAGQGTDSVYVLASSDLNLTVIATNSANCKDTSLTSIDVSSISPVLSITAQPIQIHVGQDVQLEANYDPNYTYNWFPDSTLNFLDIHDPIAKPRTTTNYYLTVQNQWGCQITDSIQVDVLPPICGNPVIFVPNAFSPDGDGYNDVLMVNGNHITEMTMAIYNRWGEKVFETNDQSIGWDGFYKGALLPADVYGYYMQCTCDGGGTLSLKGNITLLR